MAVRGLAVLDRRTLGARHLLDWRAALLADLGGEAAISAAKLALVEMAVRTRLFLDHIDAFLLEEPSLVVKRKRRRHHLMPLVVERGRLAETLSRLLGQLGLEKQAPKAVNLAEYLATRQDGGTGPGP